VSDLYYIAGPPGTGKTRELTRLAQRAVEARGRGSVAIASLTKTAANEVAGRNTNLPEEAIGTLHAHALRALGIHHDELAETHEGLAAWNAEHPASRLHPSGGDTGEDRRPGAQQIHAEVMAQRARMVPRDRWTAAQLEHDAMWRDYCQQTGRWDFADLIENARYERHHLYPSVWLIDEAQDLSRLELSLVQAWAKHADTTVLVGDADQTLYRWRGADPAALAALPYAGRKALTQSYRVPAAVHRLAQTWIRRSSSREDVSYQPTADAGAVVSSRASRRSPDLIAQMAIDEAHQGNEVMVLASCRHMIAPIARALVHAGEPIHNPHRPNVPEWNPLRNAAGLTLFLQGYDRQRPWTWSDLRKIVDPLDGRTLGQDAKSMIELQCRPGMFGEQQDDRPVTLEKVMGISPRLLSQDLEWYRSHLKRRDARSMQDALAIARKSGWYALAAPPLVQVGTAHSVKGGQADVVFFVPDLSPTAQRHSWSWGHQSDRRDDVLRLGYVAVTRARKKVVLLSPADRAFMPIRSCA
jgi:superfamily I DNA/RNA helicase